LNLLKFEIEEGKYDFTISLLDLIINVSKYHPLEEFEKIYKFLPYVCYNIFSLHDSWRYKSLEQRWLIGLKVIKFNDKSVSKYLIS
jgi:hypothetical protein